MLPCWRSTASWKSSSLRASSRIDERRAPDDEGEGEGDAQCGELNSRADGTSANSYPASSSATRSAPRGNLARLARRAADCCLEATYTAPAASTAAKPPRMYQRYFCRESGASVVGPSPPPGPASRPCSQLCPPEDPCAAPASPRSCKTPSPEILKARGCPTLVLEATCTMASG